MWTPPDAQPVSAMEWRNMMKAAMEWDEASPGSTFPLLLSSCVGERVSDSCVSAEPWAEVVTSD